MLPQLSFKVGVLQGIIIFNQFKMKQFLAKNVLYFALIQALAATFGSLYASEILKFIPCVLCWYQRVAMYPLIPILIVGIIKKDRNLPLYVLPLSIFGAFVALYQVLLQAGIIPENATPCTFGVSCITKYLNLWGFVDFPFLSLLAFAFIIGSMILYARLNSKR